MLWAVHTPQPAPRHPHQPATRTRLQPAELPRHFSRGVGVIRRGGLALLPGDALGRASGNWAGRPVEEGFQWVPDGEVGMTQ